MPPDMPPPQWEASLQVRSDEKYPGSQLLMTSRELGWANISAELRSHPRGIITRCSGGDTGDGRLRGKPQNHAGSDRSDGSHRAPEHRADPADVRQRLMGGLPSRVD